MRGVLTALRVGFNLLTLRSLRGKLPPPAARAVDQALMVLSRYFRALKNGRPDVPRPDLQRAVTALIAHPSPDTVDALMAIVAVGSAFDRHRDFFRVEEPHALHAAFAELPA
jgi:hypothetical protein